MREEFYCGKCGKFKPVSVETYKTDTGKIICGACHESFLKRKKRNSKKNTKRVTKILRSNVDLYIKNLRIS